MIAPFQQRQHILTIALEDYFQVGAFNKFVQKNQWYRFETRLEKNTQTTLSLLEHHHAKATFFVLGWVAKRFPQLIKTVADAGHEVAIKGYYHRSIREMTPEEFQSDCLQAKEVVEAATGQQVVGYRLADGWFGPQDVWALDVLASIGFGYDSSIAPNGKNFSDQAFRHQLHEHEYSGKRIWEVPISTASILGMTVPIAGGNYLRQLPAILTRRAIARWDRTQLSPLVSYFHVWELDPEQPRLAIGGWLTSKRHYRNLHKMHDRLADMLSRYRFTSAADYLHLSTEPEVGSQSRIPTTADFWHTDTDRYTRPIEPKLVQKSSEPLKPVTIVVPLFNEEESVKYLSNTLERVKSSLADCYDVRFLLVDDGSSDTTWRGLEAEFLDKPGYKLHQHVRNFGVAAAIMTGIKRADTEIVASMDCDCTYDPLELRNMLPLLQPGVDLVTASPYHPEGHVRNVPGWRLFLSKGATWLYLRVLRQKLYTYTSCFRVYRRSSVAGMQLRHGRYLGVAELVGRIDLTGGTIVEHPATLEVRMLGRSKMKTVSTIFGHLRLMARLAWVRAFGLWSRAHRDQVIREVLVSHRDNQNVLIRKHAPGVSATETIDVRKVVINPLKYPMN